MNFNIISVIGLGYIGLPTAAMLASHNVKVIGVDVNKEVVAMVKMGQAHISEPELGDLVKKSFKAGYLEATISAVPADVFIIAVPTPLNKIGGHFNVDKDFLSPDLTYVEAAFKGIAPVLKSGNLIILESTSPVGTTEKMAEWLAVARPDLTFPHKNGEDSCIRIAYCPERVLPGNLLSELVSNDRIIGGLTENCSKFACEVYKVFSKGKFFVTDARTAEMTKLTENSFRDVNIAFANELSIICDKQGINVSELITLANLHPRVNILKPGPGVGGHCIAVDPWFIVSMEPEDAKLIRKAREVNDAKPRWIINKVKQALAEYIAETATKSPTDMVIACFGLAFKPNIGDLRESPALEVALSLENECVGNVIAVEPNISKLPDSLKSSIQLVSMEQALASADIAVILVDHHEFIKAVPKIQSNVVKIVDSRGITNVNKLTT